MFGDDDVVAAAMIDRRVHHTKVNALKSDPNRIKRPQYRAGPTIATEQKEHQKNTK